MQYLLTLYADEGQWHGTPEGEMQKIMAAYRAYIEALKQARVLVNFNRLQTKAATVRVADGKSHVQDGPFIDSKEQVGGYFLIETPDLDAAISWAARCPGAGHGTVEVRPVWAMA